MAETWRVDPFIIGFCPTCSVGTDAAPRIGAARAGNLNKCVVTVTKSDGSTDLTFAIKQNGSSIFTANPTVTHGAAAGSQSTFTGLTSTPLRVAANDVFSIDITSGSSNWQVSIELLE